MVTGSTFLLAGVLLYGLVHIAIANYIPHMSGWSDPPGRLATALELK
jgi:hypothetical protein